MKKIADKKNSLTFKNFKELVNYGADTYGEGVAFCDLERKRKTEISYLRFRKDINDLGTYFFSVGITGKKIALLGENSYNWILTYFTAVMSSNIIVPVDKELNGEEINFLLCKADADMLIFSDTYSDIAEYINGCGKSIECICMDMLGAYVEKGELLLKGGFNDFINNKTDENEMCAVIFTSGTTGSPKGVMLSQKNLISDTLAACENVSGYGPGLLTLPLHHTFAFTAAVLGEFIYGLPIGISRSLKRFRRDMQLFKPQNMFLVPLYLETVYKQIRQTTKERGLDRLLKIMLPVSSFLYRLGIDVRRKLFASILSEFGGNLDLIICGGAYLDEKYIKFFNAVGIDVLNGYGITECSPVVAVNCNNAAVKGSVGRILSCNEVKSVDGEIYVRGDNVALGYYGQEDASSGAFENGWFKTGDLGYLDGRNLFITGRKKNLIILSNGKNVSPEELEVLIYKYSEAAEVMVYAENNLIIAEIYIDKEHSQASEADIEACVKKINAKLPRYMNIGKLKFRSSPFEKTTSQKIKRYV